MKYLVPLARANKPGCEQLIAGLGDTHVSVREPRARRALRCVEARRPCGKQSIVAEPLLFLRALSWTAPELDDESTLRGARVASRCPPTLVDAEVLHL